MESRLVGYLKGAEYVADTRSFRIKKIAMGEALAAGLTYGTSSKDKDGNRVYGANINVLIVLGTKSDMASAERNMAKLTKLIEDRVSIDGYYKANNYTKDGKEIKGLEFRGDIDTLQLAPFEQKSGSAPQAQQADDNIPEW
jgi:hypothetical protein